MNLPPPLFSGSILSLCLLSLFLSHHVSSCSSFGFGGQARKYEPGFSITYGKFSPMPQTLDQAKSSGKWKLEESYSKSSKLDPSDCLNNGAFFGFRVLEEEIALGILYDIHGVVAGYQVLLSEDFFSSSNSTYRPDLQPLFQPALVRGQKFYVLTFYFLHPSQICNQNKPKRDLSLGLVTHFGYYQTGPNPSDSHLLPVPADRYIAPAVGWKDENCLPKMGYHNMYHINEYWESNCTNFMPAFLLYDAKDGRIIGNGYFLRSRQEAKKAPFEHPPAFMIKAIAGADAPDCLLTETNTSFHVYFVNDGASISCPAA